MRAIGRYVLLGALCGLIFRQLMGLPTPAALWLLVLLVPFPLLVLTQARHAAEIMATLPRSRVYLDSIVSLWTLALVTAAVAWWSGMSAADLGVRMIPAGSLAAWSAGLVAGGLLVIAAARAAGARETALLGYLLPETRREKIAFAGLSVTAGICEELVFRGFMLVALHTATGSLLLAVLVSSGAFGVVHAYQQAAGAARAAVLGALLALSVVATGSILPAVLAHAALDLVAGLLLRRRLLD
jgi:uncharacterized protein